MPFVLTGYASKRYLAARWMLKKEISLFNEMLRRCREKALRSCGCMCHGEIEIGGAVGCTLKRLIHFYFFVWIAL